MPRNKANNQYFAEALEIRIWEELSNSTYGGTVLYTFLKEELDELDTHAELIANRIKEDFSEINSIEYVGRYTGSESGDFIINGETIKLKSPLNEQARKIIYNMDFNQLAKRNLSTPGFGKANFVGYYIELKNRLIK